MKDIKGNEIEIGMNVEVPYPNETDDIHNHSFVGTAIRYHGDYIVVEDQDGDCFDIEPERLTVVYDADDLVQVHRDVVIKAMCEWLIEADFVTLMRVYNENFDAPLLTYAYETESFVVSKEEAERVGMEVLN